MSQTDPSDIAAVQEALRRAGTAKDAIEAGEAQARVDAARTATDPDQSGLVSGVDLSRRAGGVDPSSGGAELPTDEIEAVSDQALATAVNRFADHHPGSVCVDCLTAVYQAGALAAAEAATDEMHRVRAEAVADERQRAAGMVQQFFKDHRGVDWGDVIELSKRILAAGSVPVATPQPGPIRQHSAECGGPAVCSNLRCRCACHFEGVGPVATPTEPSKPCNCADFPGLAGEHSPWCGNTSGPRFSITGALPPAEQPEER